MGLYHGLDPDQGLDLGVQSIWDIYNSTYIKFIIKY